jgi:hypothetical protein
VWEEFVEGLARGIRKFPEVPPPYFDEGLKRQPGIMYPPELSSRLCKSVCLIAVLQPEYLESRWCLEEWRAMERLEVQRLGAGRRGLIIPIVRRGNLQLFTNLAGDRQLLDLSRVVAPLREFDNIKYRRIVQDIVNRIQTVLQSLPEPDCTQFLIQGPEERLPPRAPDPSPFPHAA